MSDSPSTGKRDFFVAPVFHKPLKDLSTSQGECLVLECRVKGQPPPNILWKREGDVIEDCPDFRMLHRGEVATLVIGEVFPEDSGIFTCEATNKAGTETTSCKIVVKGSGYHTISTKSAAASAQAYQQPRPTQVLPTTQPPSYTAASSCAATSSVASSNHPEKLETQISQLNLTPKKPRYYVIESSQVTTDKKTEVVTSSVVSSRPITPNIDITSPSPTSSPLLRHELSHCDQTSSESFTSSSTTTSSSPMATTAYNAQPPHNPDENHNFKAEKDQLVQQVAKNIASPTVKQGQQENVVQGDYILYSPTLAAILEIEPQEYKISSFEQRLMNEIEYRLERTPPVNEDPEDGMFENVPVEHQSAPVFQTILKNFKAMDGTTTKFTCNVSAVPRAKVYWFKDGKQISKRSQHYIQKADAEGGHELHIPHLCMEDDGNYTALAANPQGRVSSTGRLAMVSEKCSAVANDVMSPTSAIRPSSPNICVSPRMTSPRSPSPRMTSPQVTSPRVTSPNVASPRVTSPRVTSPNVTSPTSPNSGATFKLPEKGELAADEESPVEKYYRPTFIQKPAPDTKAEEGKLVRFDVKVTGLPTPDLQWLINGRPVRQDAIHKILVRENNVHSLLFERVSPMDEGQYTITATNKAGSASANVQLHVSAREHMTAPAFVQRLTAQCVAEGDAVRLEARVVATPRPIITWKRGSDQVMHDSRTQLYEDDSGYVCLQITQTIGSDAAWYTCSATNKAGISSCNCKLDVYSPTSNVPSNRRRIRTPHRYANLAKVAGVDMREALTPDAQAHHLLPESDEL